MCDHTRKRFIVFKEDISKFPMADTVLKALETNKAEERINDGDNLYFVINSHYNFIINHHFLIINFLLDK